MEELRIKNQATKWCVYIHRCIDNNKAYIGIAKGNPENR